MSDKIFAPFTPEQVVNLNAYQARGDMHPFTCGCGADLRATEAGWVCDSPHADNVQDWAWAWMAQPQREAR